MTLKAAAHSHASQFSIFDLPIISVSSLMVISNGWMQQENAFVHVSYHRRMSQGLGGVTGKLIMHSRL